jgi:O-antigen/teichoic acid export membrane protein
MIQTRRAGSARTGGSRVFAALRDPLYRSSYALVANTGATTALGVAYWAVAAHFYDRQALGRSAALVSALILVSTFAQLNLANTLPRFIPKAGRSAGKFIAYSYGASSCVGLIGGLAFVTILPRLSSEWQFVGHSTSVAIAFVAAAVVWGVFALQDAALLSLHRPVLVPLENTVYGMCKLLMLVGVALTLPSTGIFISWVIPLAVTIPAVNWLIFHRYLKERDSAFAPSELSAREVVRFASVDYLGSALSQAYGNMLPLLVLSVLGAAANGSFYIAWTIASGLVLVAANFGTSLLVEGAAAPHRLAELTRGVIARCVLITSVGAAVLFLAARPILDIYGPGYAAHAASLLGLLALGTIPSCLVVVAISLDRIASHVGRATLTRLVLTVLVLGGSWLLMRRFGIDGVAFAWGGANLVVAVARFPTIVGAARRTASGPERVPPVRRPLAEPSAAVRAHSQPIGLHRHRAGRHRAGALQADRAAVRPSPLPRLFTPPTGDVPTPPSSPDAGQTERALQLLMSLGTEVGFHL